MAALNANQRPKIALAKQLARESGSNKFHGIPCPDCKGTERYVSNSACVYCKSQHQAESRGHRKMSMPERRESLSQHQQARRDREVANGNGDVRYLGLACSTCCSRERYVSSNKCCLCATDNLRRNFAPTGRPAPDEKPERVMPSVVPWLRDRMELLTARR